MMKTHLLEVSLRVLPESEEAVCALMERVLGQGPSVYTDAESGVMVATVYLEVKGWSRELQGGIAEGLGEIERFGLKVAAKKVSVRKIRREDWAESWKRHFKPMEIGGRLLIKPSWSRRKPKKGQAVVILDPGLSFGTGQHATTYFCLRQIVRSYKLDGAKKEGRSFLDIGTGSGILAIAAAKMGYAPIEAFDFDPESVRVSRENAVVNEVEGRIRISQNDLCRLPKQSKTRYDLVCANLIYDLLLAEAEKIINRVKPGGKLVLAGILQKQFAEVQARFEGLGLQLRATKVEKEWQSGMFEFRSCI